MSFDHLIQQLTHRTQRRIERTEHSERVAAGLSKTERMRRYLRECGPASSATLAIEADVPQCALVGALLKGDLHRGSVLRNGNSYSWNHQWDSQTQKEINQAKALLRRHGYAVIKESA